MRADDDGQPAETLLSGKLLLRPEEVATALGVGRSTVYALLRSGELPTIHIGRSLRVPVHAVEVWITEQGDPRLGRRRR